MRILLRKSTQRRLIEKSKESKELTWDNLAKELGVCEGTLRNEWRHGKTSIPVDAFRKLEKFSGDQITVYKTKEDNWGRSKGGVISKKRRKPPKIYPKRNEALAELMGIILGDGSILEDKEKGIYYLRIFFNSKTDMPYAEYVSKLIESVLGFQPRVRKMKGANCVYLSVQRKSVVDYLKTEGLIPGDKIRNKLPIPKWIFKKKQWMRACIRGLIDTDGSSYYLRPHWPNLIQIEFKNVNMVLLKDARRALILLGYHPSKIHGGNKFVLTRQKEIARYFKEIGSNNRKTAP